MATVKEITTPDDFTSHLSTLPPSSLRVVYFHAPWAAPCQQMSAVLSALASTYPADNSVSFLSLNAEDVPDVAEQYDVTAVPYVVLQRGDETLETVSGSDAARVRGAVEKYAGKQGGAGKTSLPPAQEVTRPAGEHIPSSAAAASNGATEDGTKNLSGYAPGESDPSTAPGYTSASKPTDPVDPPATQEELFKRLEGLVRSAPVMLFMKGTPSSPQCGFSRQTVGLLRERSIRYGFFNILADDEVRQGLKEYADWPTFPQLWVDGELVGGLDIVREEFEGDPEYLMQYSVKRAAAAAS